MKLFKEKLTLNKNGRGCYILDTVKGCSITAEKPKGCYNDCYAKNISSRYGFDFKNPVIRCFERDKEQLYLLDFYDTKHENEIIKKIKYSDAKFIRIGEMGDPSEDWKHTLNICKIISEAKKPIVIITKHWKTIQKELLKEVEKLNLTINTSISALDNDEEIEHRLNQYNRLKNYCNSVLRIVSCDFNLENHEGKLRSIMQKELFKNENIIDTVFRPSVNNPFVIDKVINVKKVKFLKSNVLASVYNDKTYLGSCENCPEKCGLFS
jgi:hypothetical protein